MIKEKPVTIKKDNLQIVGMLHRPAKTNRSHHPAIILLHGFTGNKSESHFIFTSLARNLADAGFICLRFDFTGSGDSSGSFKEMTIETELEDAKIALQYLLSLNHVDKNKIGLLGLSMGGCVAALLAGISQEIKSLVLWSAVSNPEQQFSKLKNNYSKILDKATNSWIIDRNGLAVSSDFFEILPELKPLSTISSYKGPAFIIHGEKDMAVPLSAAIEYKSALEKRQNATTNFLMIKDADHVFSTIPFKEQVINSTVQWFTKTLL